VQGPAQGAGGGLVPRQDEGQDVGGDFFVRQAGSAVLVAGQQQGAEQVLGRRVPSLDAGAAGLDEAGDALFEETGRTETGQTTQTGRPVRRAQHVQRIDTGAVGQELIQGALEAAGLAAQFVGEHGGRQDVEGQAGHLAVDIQHPAARRQGPAGDARLTNLRHTGVQGGHLCGGEKRRQDAPDAAPGVPLGQQQALGQHGTEDAALQVALHIA